MKAIFLNSHFLNALVSYYKNEGTSTGSMLGARFLFKETVSVGAESGEVKRCEVRLVSNE